MREYYTGAMNQTVVFTNPWADAENFIPLGVVDHLIHVREIRKPVVTRYEMYAINGPTEFSIKFGARFGNAGSEFVSSSAGFYRDLDSTTIIGHVVRAYVAHKLGFRPYYLRNL